MKVLLSLITLLALFFTLNAQNVTYIDITQAKYEEINAEKIFENIRVVPLETHEDGLLTKSASYYLTEKHVIGMNFLEGAYLFDKNTGHFIREISSHGQGPDQYIGPLSNRYGIDEKNSILFANSAGPSGKSWKCINIGTNKVESTIKKPLPENINDFHNPQVPWFIKDNVYISFCNNRTGKNKTRLVVYDIEGNIIKRYLNHFEYDTKGMTSFPSYPGIFYYYNNQTYFKEWNYNDTIFCVDEKGMSPHIVFELGDKQPSYYHQGDTNHSKGKYLINFAHESDAFVLFNFSCYKGIIEIFGSKYSDRGATYTGYYDKKSKQTYISAPADLKKTGYVISGIPIGFCPVSINMNNEMVAYIDPEILMEHKDKIGPEYKKIFQNIQEDDNPIVIIAKLRD